MVINGTVAFIGTLVIFVGLAAFLDRSKPHEWSRTKRHKVIAKLKRRRDKINDKLSEVYGGGTACPNCLRWPWDHDSPNTWTDTTQPAKMTCGTCGYVSHWVDGPGIMLPVLPSLAPVVLGQR